MVPSKKADRIYNGDGKAFVTNVDGAIRVSVASADVAADRTRGSLRINSGSGSVDLRDATGDVQLETGSGDLTVSGVQGARLRLETGSGKLSLTNGKAH